ncbi:MAG: hypothetical protein WDM79_05225 [Terricaulis sp.]
MAAGLTMEWDQLERLRDFLSSASRPNLRPPPAKRARSRSTATGAISAIDLGLLAALDQIGPYGAGHTEPLFALANVQVCYSKLVKTIMCASRWRTHAAPASAASPSAP